MRLLKQALADRTGLKASTLSGRTGPFESTPWREDLLASRTVLCQAGRHVRVTLRGGSSPLTLATDCSVAIGTLPEVAKARPDARVLWLDAHADYDTPETTTTGFLGCMSLSGACGAWDTDLGVFPAERAVLCGARSKPSDFDIKGQREAEASAMTMVPISADTAHRVRSALGEVPVYVHLDPDVLDPSVNPVWYARPGGLTDTDLLDLLSKVAARGEVVGMEVTAFHSSDEADLRSRMTELLLEAIRIALDLH